MDRVVVLETGDQFVCHHNHEWIVNYTNTKTKEKKHKTVSVEEMESRGILCADNHRKFVIPVRDVVKGEEKELAVHPYVMGAWLGDGSTTKGQICASPEDASVLDKCRKFYPEGSAWTHNGKFHRTCFRPESIRHVLSERRLARKIYSERVPHGEC